MKNAVTLSGTIARYGNLTRTIIIAMFCLAFSNETNAQCPDAYGHADHFVHLHDTTIGYYFADSSLMSAHTSFRWTFSDGVTATGSAMTRPYTGNFRTITSFSISVTYTDTASGCSGTDTLDVYDNYYPTVFNCGYLFKPNISNIFQMTECSPTSAQIDVVYDEDNTTWEGTTPIWKTVFNWGNNDSEVHNSSMTSGSYYFWSYHPASYVYGGTYRLNMHTVVINPTDSFQCPVPYDTTFCWRVSGTFGNIQITGDTTLCAGDTLLLVARDTTRWHNIAHELDTSITHGIVLDLSSGTMTSSFDFWYADTGTSPGVGVAGDTVLRILSVSPAASGLYTFFHGSCSATNNSVTVTVNPASFCATGTRNIINYNNSDIDISPNPGYGFFSIRLPEHEQGLTVSISDIWGKNVRIVVVNSSAHELNVDLNNEAAGIYVVKVETDGIIYRKKLVKL